MNIPTLVAVSRWRMLNMADFSACPDLFESVSDCIDVTSLPPSQRALREAIEDFDLYFASLHVMMDRDALEHATRLRVIATASTGLDHIDVEFARQRGITVLSLKEETGFLDQITATAEMTWALLLATCRRLPWAFTAAKAGRWARDEFRGHQLSGKTLGILGYGRLGRIVAEYGNAFRMRVLACNDTPVQLAHNIELVRFDRLLAESDVLSIHVHLTGNNRRLIGTEALSKMKSGAVLINTSRGGIVDEDALLAALESGRLGGAGLDVIDGEWRQDLDCHPLIAYSCTRENLVISPHIGGATYESQQAAYGYTLGMLKRYLNEQDSGAMRCNNPPSER